MYNRGSLGRRMVSPSITTSRNVQYEEDTPAGWGQHVQLLQRFLIKEENSTSLGRE